MNADQLDAVTRAISRLPRRTAFVAMLGTGLATVLSRRGAPLVEAKRKKRHKKKSKRRKKKRKKRSRTCAEQCPEAPFCFNRAAGPPLCGTSFAAAACIACTTDQDCIDNAGSDYDPYCLTSLTQASDNVTEPFQCGDNAVGQCVTVINGT